MTAAIGGALALYDFAERERADAPLLAPLVPRRGAPCTALPSSGRRAWRSPRASAAGPAGPAPAAPPGGTPPREGRRSRSASAGPLTGWRRWPAGEAPAVHAPFYGSGAM